MAGVTVTARVACGSLSRAGTRRPARASAWVSSGSALGRDGNAGVGCRGSPAGTLSKVPRAPRPPGAASARGSRKAVGPASGSAAPLRVSPRKSPSAAAISAADSKRRPEGRGSWCRIWSHRTSSALGTPGRTWRGRQTRSWSSGASGTTEGGKPGQRPVSAAYSSAPRFVTSDSCSLGGSRPSAVRVGRPWRTASTTKPISFTEPASVTMTLSGSSRPWATPCWWPTAIASATSRTSHAARRGSRGASPSMRSRETPVPHSWTTCTRSSSSSASSTRRMWPSLTSAEVRAAVSTAGARGSSAARTWIATLRARVRSVARQNRAPECSSSRSSRRNRDATRLPGPMALCGTRLPSGETSGRRPW